MTTPADTPAAVPQPTFPHRAYGVGVTGFGDEGSYMAEGHVPDLRFLAACNHLARTELGLSNMLDDPLISAADTAVNISRVWAVPEEPPYPGEHEWYVDWGGVTQDTPGAIPVTIWEP